MELFKKLFKKNFIIFLVITVLVSSSPNSYAASKNKSSLLSIQENEAVKDLVVLDGSISRYKQKTDSLNSEIASLEKNASALKVKLKEKESKVKHKKKILGKRVRSMYKESNVSFVEVLLSSKSMTEMVNKIGFLDLVAKNDTKLIRNISKEQNNLDKTQSDLDKKITYLKRLRAENEKAYQMLMLKEKSKRQYVEDLRSKKERVDKISAQVSSVRKKIISLGSSKQPKGKTLRVMTTGYAARCSDCGTNGQTSTGMQAAHGVAAVSADPSNRILPIGTKIYIPGYGKAVIGDVGGGVGSDQIDLCFETHSEGKNWGVRWVNVTVYD